MCDERRPTWLGCDPEALAGLEPVEIRARELISLVCLLGGVDPPTEGMARPLGGLRGLLATIQSEPETPLTLTAAFDRGGGPYQFPREDTPFQRRLDLQVLRRLNLVPGDTRSARELFHRLRGGLPNLDDVCYFVDEGECWPSWPMGAIQAYPRGLLVGLPPAQSPEQMARIKRRSVDEIERSGHLLIRPHHLMCIACYYGGGGEEPLANDNLLELRLLMQANPEIEVELVEGQCMVCPPCQDFEPRSGRCVARCDLRDRLKDLDVMRRLDLLPGTRMSARDLYTLLFSRIATAAQICDYGADRSPEWEPCGSARAGRYEAARARGMFED